MPTEIKTDDDLDKIVNLLWNIGFKDVSTVFDEATANTIIDAYVRRNPALVYDNALKLNSEKLMDKAREIFVETDPLAAYCRARNSPDQDPQLLPAARRELIDNCSAESLLSIVGEYPKKKDVELVNAAAAKFLERQGDIATTHAYELACESGNRALAVAALTQLSNLNAELAYRTAGRNNDGLLQIMRKQFACKNPQRAIIVGQQETDKFLVQEAINCAINQLNISPDAKERLLALYKTE